MITGFKMGRFTLNMYNFKNDIIQSITGLEEIFTILEEVNKDWEISRNKSIDKNPNDDYIAELRRIGIGIFHLIELRSNLASDHFRYEYKEMLAYYFERIFEHEFTPLPEVSGKTGVEKLFSLLRGIEISVPECSNMSIYKRVINGLKEAKVFVNNFTVSDSSGMIRLTDLSELVMIQGILSGLTSSMIYILYGNIYHVRLREVLEECERKPLSTVLEPTHSLYNFFETNVVVNALPDKSTMDSHEVDNMQIYSMQIYKLKALNTLYRFVVDPEKIKPLIEDSGLEEEYLEEIASKVKGCPSEIVDELVIENPIGNLRRNLISFIKAVVGTMNSYNQPNMDLFTISRLDRITLIGSDKKVKKSTIYGVDVPKLEEVIKLGDSADLSLLIEVGLECMRSVDNYLGSDYGNHVPAAGVTIGEFLAKLNINYALMEVARESFWNFAHNFYNEEGMH